MTKINAGEYFLCVGYSKINKNQLNTPCFCAVCSITILSIIFGQPDLVLRDWCWSVDQIVATQRFCPNLYLSRFRMHLHTLYDRTVPVTFHDSLYIVWIPQWDCSQTSARVRTQCLRGLVMVHSFYYDTWCLWFGDGYLYIVIAGYGFEHPDDVGYDNLAKDSWKSYKVSNFKIEITQNFDYATRQ